MASFVLFIFTILLLPVALSAEKCFVCTEDGNLDKSLFPDSCDDVKAPQNCSEKQCLSVASNTRLSICVPSTIYLPNPLYAGGPLISSFSRTCVEPSNNLMGSFYFDFGNASTLDFTSKVSDKKFKALGPPIRIYENGKSCPKCFRTGDNNCDADGEVLCVGDLENCVELNGEISHEYSDSNLTITVNTTIPFAGKSCVSQSVCNMGNDKSVRLGSYKFRFINIQCSEANGALSSLRRLAFTLEKKDFGPQVAFFFPCLLGIFAVKILS